MVYFRDRVDAGKQLVSQLLHYQNHENAVVIGLPRGGVVNGYEVAVALGLPLDVVCPRKIGAPMNPEYALGAITETGERVFEEGILERLGVEEDYVQKTIEEEKKQAEHRLEVYRKGLPPRDLSGKIVIIVDDGLATGSTMRAAIKTVRADNAERIVMAIPVSPSDTLREIQQLVDEEICLDTPSDFYAVGQFYQSFGQTTDEEVIELMQRAAQRR